MPRCNRGGGVSWGCNIIMRHWLRIQILAADNPRILKPAAHEMNLQALHALLIYEKVLPCLSVVINCFASRIISQGFTRRSSGIAVVSLEMLKTGEV